MVVNVITRYTFAKFVFRAIVWFWRQRWLSGSMRESCGVKRQRFVAVKAILYSLKRPMN